MKKAVTKKESENMGAEIFAAVDILESTKGIPRSYMLEKIEAALVSAYKKESGAVNVRIALDGEKKTFRLYQQKTVVEEVEDEKEQISLADARAISRRYNVGDVVEFELKTKAFGQLAPFFKDTVGHFVVGTVVAHHDAVRQVALRMNALKAGQRVLPVIIRKDDDADFRMFHENPPEADFLLS